MPLEAPWKRQPPRSDPTPSINPGEIWLSGDICRDRTRSRPQLPLPDKEEVPGSSPGSPTDRGAPESPATAGSREHQRAIRRPSGRGGSCRPRSQFSASLHRGTRAPLRSPGAMSDTARMTAAAYAALKAEIERLETEGRREKAEEISVARGFGDLKENAEYHSAKNDAALLEAKISRLTERLRFAEIVEAVADGPAGMGSTVTYVD